MAITDTLSDPSAQAQIAGSPPSPAGRGPLLVSLSSLDPGSLQATLTTLSNAFPGESLLVATADAVPETLQEEHGSGSLTILPYTPAITSRESWLLTAADYFNAYKTGKDHNAGSILLLGGDSASLSAEAVRAMADALRAGADLVSPGYLLGPREGLVNAAILYPVTRALFGTRPRYPLAIDLGLSSRMAERLATVAQRFTAINQPDALMWPVAEAAAGGLQIVEVSGVERALPSPGSMDLNAMLARVAGSLFAEVDAKAALWQRTRTSPGPRPPTRGSEGAATEATPDVSPMLETFRIAYSNLHEIWSLVLPPNSLLGLKRLSTAPAASFRMPDALWARTVYDFILAFRLRTLNRGHLLGALTPLYLAWVASHLVQVTDAASADRHIESVAAAFEADKPYLVSRWRWPDRFNP